MSGLLVGAALGVLVLWASVGRSRQEPIGRLPPQPQPRTKEEARRWRAEFEARK